jgi:hypothetical protein
MRNNSFLKIFLIVLSVVFFASCDKDFNSIGGDLIGDNNFDLAHNSYNVLAYNQKIDPFQSNNLPVNPLGVYEDPIFGTTEASFATQVILASANPTIGANPQIDNVVLSIPYFSHATAIDAATGNSTYVLDSIYGNAEGKIKLSVYENGYFLRDLDPSTAFTESQKYYSNQGSDFDGLKKPTLLNDSINTPSQNDAFFFDPSEIRKTTKDQAGVETTTRTAPAMRLALNKAYFKTRIIDAAASGKLVTNDIFKDYFRGLYFKVEKSGSNPGRLAMMDFKSGTITINYKEDYVTTVNGQSTTTRVAKSIVLNLTGNTVSLLSNSDASAYANATNSSNVDAVNGDEKLYVRGGQGSMAIVELFDKTDIKGYDSEGNATVGANGVPDQLDDLRNPSDKKKLLINEANLVFHIDNTSMGDNILPKRIYLYDLTNATPVVDYLYDGTSSTNAKNGLLIYSGLLNTPESGDNNYKIRITNHVKNLIKNADSTNVKLGVVVTENINSSAMNKLRTATLLPDGTTSLSKVPQASVMSPVGVVLHGGKSTVPDNKKLKLEIYYTKPN